MASEVRALAHGEAASEDTGSCHDAVLRLAWGALEPDDLPPPIEAVERAAALELSATPRDSVARR